MILQSPFILSHWDLAISFFVPGVPQPGGSKTAHVVRRKGGEIVMVKGRPLVNMVDDGKYNAEWRQTVAYFAKQYYRGPLIDTVMGLDVLFVMPRPKDHFNKAGQLKNGSAYFHTKKPDTTKLIRACEDALTNILWLDDKLIGPQFGNKIYGLQPGAHIKVFLPKPAPVPPLTGAGTPSPSEAKS